MFSKVALGCVVLLASAALAQASVVSNGDFETGDLSGWNINAATDAPIVIGYNSLKGLHQGAFGESVPTPLNGLTSGAYFFADSGFQSISQNLVMSADTPYTLSFDIYAPQNGRSNLFDASLFATLNGSPVSKVFSADSLSDGWVYYSTTFAPTASTSYNFALNFRGGGAAAADFVIDNVRVASEVAAVTAVPEPSTWALMILGFGGIGFMTYKRATTRGLTAPNHHWKFIYRLRAVFLFRWPAL
jgi:hypothetical protein